MKPISFEWPDILHPFHSYTGDYYPAAEVDALVEAADAVAKVLRTDYHLNNLAYLLERTLKPLVD